MNQNDPKIIEEFIDAAWQNDTGSIDSLIEKNAWLADPANPYLLDALHTACNSCQKNSAQLLVEKYHADVNAILDPERGMTALHEALNSHAMDIAAMLVKNGADTTIKCETANLEARMAELVKSLPTPPAVAKPKWNGPKL